QPHAVHGREQHGAVLEPDERHHEPAVRREREPRQQQRLRHDQRRRRAADAPARDAADVLVASASPRRGRRLLAPALSFGEETLRSKLDPMARPRVSAGGGVAAIAYTLRMGRKAGGVRRLYGRMRQRNACKTCALGMGGQRGGMVNEAGHFPEVCKKSLQAQAAAMQGPIGEAALREHPPARLAGMTPAAPDAVGRIAFPLTAEPHDSHFRRISWEEALETAAKALRAASPERVFFYSSGRASNEAAFLMQVVARLYGTPHIHN